MPKIKAYKGFDKDMTCRGFQYEEGKDYETDKAELCESGFHACERPLDVYRYYDPATSVYHEVELDGDIVRDANGNDSKVAATKIHIGRRLTFEELAEACRAYDAERGAAKIGDDYSSVSGGNWSSVSGGNGSSVSGGYGSNVSGGNWSNVSGGNKSNVSGGYWSSVSGGYKSNVSGGNWSSVVSRGSSSVGENGIACARGNGCCVKGGLGAVLVIAEEEIGAYNLKQWCAVVVDGKKIKADTWYTFRGRRLVEVKENG